MKRLLTPLLACAMLPGRRPGRRKPPSAKTWPNACRNCKKIDEVSKTADPGPVRNPRQRHRDLLHRCRGQLPGAGQHDRHARSRRNLTEERVDKLTAIKFDALPLKDAFTIVRGNGKRKLAVFEDPNCGYCKRFERDLQKVDNVTIHMFLYPILGAGFGGEIQKHLVRQRQDQSLAGLDGARPGHPSRRQLRHRGLGPQCGAGPQATRSPARPPWCLPTAAACPAPSTPNRSKNT